MNRLVAFGVYAVQLYARLNRRAGTLSRHFLQGDNMHNTMRRSTPINRRQFLRVAGLGPVALAIQACSSSAPAAPTDVPDIPTSAPLPTRASESSVSTQKALSPSQSGTADTARAKATKVPFDASAALVWSTLDDPAFCDRIDAMAEGFAKDSPGTRVNAVQCDGGAGSVDFALVLKSRIANAQGPDAILLIGDPSPGLVTTGLLQPLNDLLPSSSYSRPNNWPVPILAAATFEGKMYGLPLITAPYAIYYNAGAFEKKGISSKREDFPKTLEELKRVSKQFTSWSGETLTTAGYIPGLKGSDLPLWFALNGGGLFDNAKNKFVIDQERNVEIVQFILDWYKAEYHGDTTQAGIGGEFHAANASTETPKTFELGKLAMVSASILASDRLSKMSLTEEAKNWDVAPYPLGPSGKEVVTFSDTIWALVPIHAKHRDDAFKYVDYIGGKGLATPDVLSFDFGTLLPGNKAITTPSGSQAVEQSRGATFAASWLAFFLKQRDMITVFDLSPIAGSAADILGLQMDDVIHGKAKPSDALAQAQKLCQDRLEQALKKN